MIYEDGVEDNVVWKILSEMEQITVCPMATEGATILDTDKAFTNDISRDKDPNQVDYNTIYLRHSFPLLLGRLKYWMKICLMSQQIQSSQMSGKPES